MSEGYKTKTRATSSQTQIIDVYPNPASNYFIIYNYLADKNAVIELFDVNGALVKRMNSSHLATRIDCSNLANGIYIIKLSSKKLSLSNSQKILIRK